MGQITTTTNICDRCGSQHDADKYMDGGEWGQMNLAWKGDIGGRTMQGDAGGVNLSGKAWLCLKCTNEFMAFMKLAR